MPITVRTKNTLNLASTLSVGANLLATLRFYPLDQPLARSAIYLGLGSSLFLWALSVGFALVGSRPKHPVFRFLDLFFVVLLGLPVCFWLFFYVRDLIIV
jgi:hypothetical protein